MKFMFIFVWKRIREMNDNLIVRIFANVTLFISIWVTLTNRLIQGYTFNKFALIKYACTFVAITCIEKQFQSKKTLLALKN